MKSHLTAIKDRSRETKLLLVGCHVLDVYFVSPWVYQRKTNCLLTMLVNISREIPVEGTPYFYTVYNEGDIIYAFAKSKFKVKVDTKQWFK